MDSIFTGYKNIPVDEIEEDDEKELKSRHGHRILD
jgi:hypothetical protein